MLLDAAVDVTAFTGFPVSHWKKIWSTNPLSVNKEIKRRTDVGVLPNPRRLLRLAGAVLVEAHDEWQVDGRRYLSEGSIALLARPATNSREEVAAPALLTGPRQRALSAPIRRDGAAEMVVAARSGVGAHRKRWEWRRAVRLAQSP